jgi:integrase
MATRAGYGGGSLRRRGDRKWELRVSTGRDPVKGRYRYVSRTVRGTRKEAEAALAALVTLINTGAGGHTGTDASVGELVEQWLDLKRDALSVTTWEGYAGKAHFRLIPALGKVSVRKLTVRDIDAFYRALARDEQLAASTIRQIHNVLTGSLDQAVRWGWRSDNPARLATLPSVRQADIRPPAPADVMAAIERADEELALFVRLSAVLGGRRGEVGALRWTNVDLAAGDLSISKALVESRDRSIYEKDTKTHQARRIALDAATVEALRAWRSEVEARAKAVRRHGAFRRVRVQPRARRIEAVAALPLDQRMAPAPRPHRHRPSGPLARSPPLHRHPAARRGGAGEDRERAARPRSSGDNAQRLRALHPGDRPRCGRLDRRPAGADLPSRGR